MGWILQTKTEQMTYQKRCETLHKNPVLVARHFQYSVKLFFKLIVLDGPLRKTKHYEIRVEFQTRGSPHVHSFIWTLNVPTLNKSNIEVYIMWIDSIIYAELPDPSKETELC